MEGLSSDVVVLDRFVCSVIEAVVVETTIGAAKSLACLLFMMGSLPNGTDVCPREPGTFERVSIAGLNMEKKQPDPENKDGSETEDDDEDDDDGGDDQDEDAGDEEDLSGEEGNDEDEGDPEGGPEANGDGGSEDDDDDDDDDDD
ncbi:hypothetical protein F0562_012272 [Nyssa sinensis]|uniref:Uncharacterized protein n=1 Tax=Nyssa sinensis TaxID=561372 RepID=A0A5J4ZU43_9ASTE|nr:hypothetical protein F0562_012272 [Nyssa sinensis]